jgi:hypothetical protein
VLITLAKVMHEDQKEDIGSNAGNESSVDENDTFEQMVSNMTVVRMENGYIANIQPVSFVL